MHQKKRRELDLKQGLLPVTGLRNELCAPVALDGAQRGGGRGDRPRAEGPADAGRELNARHTAARRRRLRATRTSTHTRSNMLFLPDPWT